MTAPATKEPLRKEITQLCVNECGRMTDGQTNGCCQPCQLEKPHALVCDIRHCHDQVLSGNPCSRTDCAENARKAAAYDRLFKIVNTISIALHPDDFPALQEQIAAIDAEVRG